jgi:hypothetical protein
MPPPVQGAWLRNPARVRGTAPSLYVNSFRYQAPPGSRASVPRPSGDLRIPNASSRHVLSIALRRRPELRGREADIGPGPRRPRRRQSTAERRDRLIWKRTPRADSADRRPSSWPAGGLLGYPRMDGRGLEAQRGRGGTARRSAMARDRCRDLRDLRRGRSRRARDIPRHRATSAGRRLPPQSEALREQPAPPGTAAADAQIDEVEHAGCAAS